MGDGFAHGHIWPEWPQILQALIPTVPITVLSGIGAGNEFLVSSLLSAEPDQDIVILQWAQADRFDKIVQDRPWEEIARDDTIYGGNFYNLDGDRWWLSSGSQASEIQRYHSFFVQSRQCSRRLQDLQKLVQGFLASRSCSYLAISTPGQNAFSRQSRFQTIRGDQVQPSPPVHMVYLQEVILPQLPVQIDPVREARLSAVLWNSDWQPYHPDRVEIWKKIINDLDIE